MTCLSCEERRRLLDEAKTAWIAGDHVTAKAKFDEVKRSAVEAMRRKGEEVLRAFRQRQSNNEKRR